MRVLSLFIISVMLISCNNTASKEDPKLKSPPGLSASVQPADEMDWLLGEWERLNEEDGKTTLEFWEKENPGRYKGIGFTMQNGDTIKLEKMTLAKSESLWNLTVMVLNEDAVTFTGTHFSDKTFTAENNEIEFPNTIKYWMKADTLKASVSNSDFEILFDFMKR